MINCIIVDDEPLALELLEDYLHRVPEINLVAKCNSAARAREALEQHEVHLMFLDIHMPEVSGMQLLHSLKMKNRPLVVLTTAYNQYAIQGYELDVADYLMKPFSFERLLKCINKMMYRLQPAVPAATVENNTASRSYIFVKAEYKTYRIDLQSIVYIEGLKDYSKIMTTTGSIMTLKSLKNIEVMLPKQDFMRVHRSYIIAISKIKMVSKSVIVMVNDVNIPISEGFRDDFNEMINQHHI